MRDLEPGRSVAVIAAMVPEVRPTVRALGLTRLDEHTWHGRAGDRAVVAAVTSMGTEAAARTTRRVLDDHRVGWVVAIGICGAIDPALGIGDLVVPVAAHDETVGRTCTPTALPGHVPSGSLLTTNHLHSDPADLAALRDRGFVAVDMETAAIGLVCEARDVPWSVLRGVSDRAGDPTVDADLVGMAKPDGTADPGAVARYLVRHPLRIPKLAELNRGMGRAVAASTAATLRALGHTDDG
jgi:nucleoside phosphorylase